ncbi:hypothetical protein H6G54_13780 [Anabaena cylindrica FACHB-243]|uniref:Uncharacterized protein n=1 Tax=Anabaena cylindrica (strain ATCC 27899 / PCC 7122) TaxID=272123 RepID=K9ZLC8_ANACC|nr:MULTISPECIES: hypothetical protein [Anabaena]AFZ59589.1 hypothetical protein Anacy_4224 [Anabaena cylindrica PCC 7122]MBD2418746.1 hypothetical protein [Anabaena cylindrica FACHB-243]MBY5281627.1 hypothetical protein [Anabaena sp. CCAP 1446/1C]MBY5309153.1 hypothetical protein [Anabaena sp. CCAP 1446/1C]MCM2406310.1 hypothetical protein [Anabaena sp. CCAP 1446/1C]
MNQELISGYIYHKQLVSSDELDNLITKISQPPNNYYFLRYSHGVSGICQKLPADRGEIEGQVFNSLCEMRWKKYKLGYEVLILSKQEFNLQGFEKLIGNWAIFDRSAYLHDPEETRFPKGFIFKDEDHQLIKHEEITKKMPIKQRYFQDADTATTHFIALTVN